MPGRIETTGKLPLHHDADALIAILALAKFAIQFAAAGRYGIFADELYDLACARHLDWGYVDQPPLIALIAWAVTHTLGASLYALRFLPAVAGALLVVVTARIARELGGGRFAQGLAGFAVIPVPIYLMVDHWLTMNAFEPLIWTLVAYLALRMVRRQDPRMWLAIGLLCGIGIENKYSMLLPILALPPALLATPHRRLLASVWCAAGVAVGFLVFLPNLLWLVRHDFPFLEFEHNARLNGAQLKRPPLDFIADQMLIMNPVLSALWIGGLAWLLAAKPAREARFLGWFFLAIALPLLILRAKNYYLVPAYPLLFAAGAVGFEALTRQNWRWARGVYAGAVLAAGIVLAPLVLPILPIEDFLAYQSALGGFRPVVYERSRPGLLPLQFEAELGWEEMVQATAKVYAALPPAEQANTAIFGNDYSEAGAIDYFGPKYGLPTAISHHVSYWLWGPQHYDGKTVIVLGSDGTGDREHFGSVEIAGRVENPFSRPDENFDIYLCRDLTGGLHALWPRIKKWVS